MSFKATSITSSDALYRWFFKFTSFNMNL